MSQLDYQSHPPVQRRRLMLRRRVRLISFALDVFLIGFGLFLLTSGYIDRAIEGAVILLLGIAALGWHVYLRITAPITAAEYARKLVNGVKLALESPSERVLAGPEAFAPLHVEFYDRNQELLSALGFRPLGDWTERKAVKFYGVHSVTRTMLSGDGTIIASISESAPVGKQARNARANELFRKQKLLMSSRFDDDLVVHTTNDATDQREYLPNVRLHYKATQSPADLLAEHRKHVATVQAESPERTLVRTQTLEEIFRRLDETIAAVAAHKRRQGYLTAQQYRAFPQRELTPWEEAVAAELEKLQSSNTTKAGTPRA
jgi:hypothetical protein